MRCTMCGDALSAAARTLSMALAGQFGQPHQSSRNCVPVDWRSIRDVNMDAKAVVRADFRSDINGLRAWAVAAVVFYHFGVLGFGGGS
jgi:hypothetical protein